MIFTSLIDFLNESRDKEVRSKLSISNRVTNFLKKYKYEYEPTVAGNIFVSFKTGNFETIVPPVRLAGDLYTSPQGLYCFDFNVSKKSLYGNGDISEDNFSFKNLKGDDVIGGFGYGNQSSAKVRELGKNVQTAYVEGFNLPRYMYLFKVKDGSIILSRDTNNNVIEGLFLKLIKDYAYCFLKKNIGEKFDKNKKSKFPIEFSTAASKEKWQEIDDYFKKHSDEYINDPSYLIGKILLNNDLTYRYFYDTVTSMADHDYVRTTLIFNTIGVDGFTQYDTIFLHPNPKKQTVIFNQRCVEDILKIDLVSEYKNDKLLKDIRNKEIGSGLEKGDIVKIKGSNLVLRLQETPVLEKDKKGDKYSISSLPFDVIISDMVKVNEDDIINSNTYQFINGLNNGDYIKLTTEEERNKYSVVIQIVDKKDNFFKVNTYSFYERNLDKGTGTIYANYHDGSEYVIGGSDMTEIDNKNNKYDYNKLFDPILVNTNNNNFLYWHFNSDKLKKMGINYKDFINGHPMSKDTHQYDSSILKIEDTGDRNSVKIISDMELYSILEAFKKSILIDLNHIQNRGWRNNKVSKECVLDLYRGNLDNPLKEFVMSRTRDFK